MVPNLSSAPTRQAGWTIYNDKNENRELDVGEESMTTGVDGLYSFSVPAGAFVFTHASYTPIFSQERTNPRICSHIGRTTDGYARHLSSAPSATLRGIALAGLGQLGLRNRRYVTHNGVEV